AACGADINRGAGRAAGVDRSDSTARHRARVQGLCDSGKDAAEQTGSGEHRQAQENPPPQALSAHASQTPAIAERSIRILHPDLQERSGLVPALSVACTPPGDSKTRSLRVEKTEKADLSNGLNPPGRTHHAADPRASRNDRTSLLAGHRDRLAETNPSAHQRRDRYPSTSPTRPPPPPSRPLTRTQSASTATTHRPLPARPDAAGPLPVSP